MGLFLVRGSFHGLRKWSFHGLLQWITHDPLHIIHLSSPSERFPKEKVQGNLAHQNVVTTNTRSSVTFGTVWGAQIDFEEKVQEYLAYKRVGKCWQVFNEEIHDELNMFQDIVHLSQSCTGIV